MRGLAATAAAAGLPWLEVRVGLPADATGWTCCADVDTAFMAAWEATIADGLRDAHGRSHPLTAAGYALDWYARVPAVVGGAFFRLARRVPRLEPAAVAFHRAPGAHPDAVALLEPGFWCLPTDAAVDDPAATPVADEAALAAVLRAQVRIHADAFLARYRPGARLPRRALLGAFVDGLDLGVWYGGEPGPPARREILATAAAALPADSPELGSASSLYSFTDLHGRARVSRRRQACCFHFKTAGRACATCPRTTDAERCARASTEP